ncbi:glutaredoxin domain-containing protein [Granulosicoccus sp. 3-233]|uniref:glutaredoxin domain-containing protein n=1 Tax=Granulosicoccus sp. 3-233 TaxID=3417969 RepID=UPI003D346ADE
MSDSETVDSKSGPSIVMYESDWCGFCRAARRLLDAKGWSYESRNVDGNAELRAEMQKLSGRTSVPQIFFGDRHIGGFDDMAALESDGELDDAYASIR